MLEQKKIVQLQNVLYQKTNKLFNHDGEFVYVFVGTKKMWRKLKIKYDVNKNEYMVYGADNQNVDYVLLYSNSNVDLVCEYVIDFRFKTVILIIKNKVKKLFCIKRIVGIMFLFSIIHFIMQILDNLG